MAIPKQPSLPGWQEALNQVLAGSYTFYFTAGILTKPKKDLYSGAAYSFVQVVPEMFRQMAEDLPTRMYVEVRLRDAMPGLKDAEVEWFVAKTSDSDEPSQPVIKFRWGDE